MERRFALPAIRTVVANRRIVPHPERPRYRAGPGGSRRLRL